MFGIEMAAVIAAQIAQPAAVDAVAPVAVEAAADTVPVELMVMTEVSTTRAKPGDVVKLRVDRPVERAGTVLVPVGTPAFGEVLAVSRSGAAMKRGGLTIRLTRLMLGDREIALDETFAAKGRGGKSDDLVKVVLVPMYALFAPGNAGKFKAGDRLTARLPLQQLVR